MISFIESEVDKVPSYKMLNYTYRFYNPESEAEFGQWLARMDWAPLLAAQGSNAKTEMYQAEVVGAMERCFPPEKINRPPWYNWKVRKRIAQKKGIYRREGRSVKW